MNQNDTIYIGCIVTCAILIALMAFGFIPEALCAALCLLSFISTFLLLSNKKEEDEL
jgi:MFS superfamily sulfate permease-like transporter